MGHAPGRMTAREVLERFEALGTEQNRKVYARHSDQQIETFGVSFATLAALKKNIGRDQSLAMELWADGRFEPQTLACMIADPSAFDEKLLDEWAEQSADYAIADSVAKEIALQTTFGRNRADDWIDADPVVVRRAGWTALALFAGKADVITAQQLLPYLNRIESEIHTAPNRVKQAMNSALIAFGGRDEASARAVIPVAERIGTVNVDHGKTYCKTPAAIPYIEKMLARKSSRPG